MTQPIPIQNQPPAVPANNPYEAPAPPDGPEVKIFADLNIPEELQAAAVRLANADTALAGERTGVGVGKRTFIPRSGRGEGNRTEEVREAHAGVRNDIAEMTDQGAELTPAEQLKQLTAVTKAASEIQIANAKEAGAMARWLAGDIKNEAGNEKFFAKWGRRLVVYGLPVAAAVAVGVLTGPMVGVVGAALFGAVKGGAIGFGMSQIKNSAKQAVSRAPDAVRTRVNERQQAADAAFQTAETAMTDAENVQGVTPEDILAAQQEILDNIAQGNTNASVISAAKARKARRQMRNKIVATGTIAGAVGGAVGGAIQGFIASPDTSVAAGNTDATIANGSAAAAEAAKKAAAEAAANLPELTEVQVAEAKKAMAEAWLNSPDSIDAPGLEDVREGWAESTKEAAASYEKNGEYLWGKLDNNFSDADIVKMMEGKGSTLDILGKNGFDVDMGHNGDKYWIENMVAKEDTWIVSKDGLQTLFFEEGHRLTQTEQAAALGNTFSGGEIIHAAEMADKLADQITLTQEQLTAGAKAEVADIVADYKADWADTSKIGAAVNVSPAITASFETSTLAGVMAEHAPAIAAMPEPYLELVTKQLDAATPNVNEAAIRAMLEQTRAQFALAA